MTTYSSAFKAALEYARQSGEEIETIGGNNWLVNHSWLSYTRNLLDEGIIQPVPHPRGWAPTEWTLAQPIEEDDRWYAVSKANNSEPLGPFETKSKALEELELRRSNKIEAGLYQTEEHYIGRGHILEERELW